METIRTLLPCYRCRYDLTGQPVQGRCSECGLPVVTSLAATVDHAQNPEVALHSPWRVAAAIITCGLATLACVTLQLGAPMLLTIETMLGRSSRMPVTIRLVGWIGSAIMIAGVVSLLHLALGRRESALRAELGRWRTWLVLGAWAWFLAAGTASALQWNQVWLPEPLRNALPWAGVAVQLPGMAAMLSGLHVLLAITGRRSQAFAEAHQARQGVQLLNATAALALVFSIASPVLQYKLGWLWLAHSSRALAGCMSVLLLFGSAYLVANTWWVARALVMPPMRMDRALGS